MIDQENKPILFTGPVNVDGPVADPLLNIVTETHPILYRNVEVYQWVEKSENIEERRGNQVRRGTKYNYKSQWCSSFTDSKNFRDQNYNHNKRPDISSEVLRGG